MGNSIFEQQTQTTINFFSCLVMKKKIRKKKLIDKAELLQECILFLVYLYARDILVMKKLEIEKTKPTFIKSVLKVEY